jgi:hypothetical protein
MSTTANPDTVVSYAEPEFEQVASYKSISKAAVFSLGLGIFALAGFLFSGLLALALVGLGCGLYAISAIRRYPDEVTGLPAAIAGVILCAVTFTGGTAMHVIEYATELPEGYTSAERRHFWELQPDKSRPELPVSPTAIELSGQKIFIKGYVHPEFNRGDVKKFVLVPDMGTCCFGGQPKPTDMIEVTLRDPHRIRYNTRLRKVAGVFRVDPAPQPVKGFGGIYYQLDAEYAK